MTTTLAYLGAPWHTLAHLRRKIDRNLLNSQLIPTIITKSSSQNQSNHKINITNNKINIT
jgi:hypothetical protein